MPQARCPQHGLLTLPLSECSCTIACPPQARIIYRHVSLNDCQTTTLAAQMQGKPMRLHKSFVITVVTHAMPVIAANQALLQVAKQFDWIGCSILQADPSDREQKTAGCTLQDGRSYLGSPLGDGFYLRQVHCQLLGLLQQLLQRLQGVLRPLAAGLALRECIGAPGDKPRPWGITSSHQLGLQHISVQLQINLRWEAQM